MGDIGDTAREPRLSAEAEELLRALECDPGSASDLLERSIQLIRGLCKDNEERKEGLSQDGLREKTNSYASTEEKLNALQFTYTVMLQGAILLENRTDRDVCIRAEDMRSGANLLRWVRGRGSPWSNSIRTAAADLADALCSASATRSSSRKYGISQNVAIGNVRASTEEVGSRQESEEYTREGLAATMDGGAMNGSMQLSSGAVSVEVETCLPHLGSGRLELSDDGKDVDSRSNSVAGTPRYCGDGRPVVLSRRNGIVRRRHRVNTSSRSLISGTSYSSDSVPLVRARGVTKKRATLPPTLLRVATHKSSSQGDAPEKPSTPTSRLARHQQEKGTLEVRTKGAKGTASKKSSAKPMSAEALKKAEAHCPCISCGTRHTPQWRRGPDGELNMCNACGVRLRKGTLKRK